MIIIVVIFHYFGKGQTHAMRILMTSGDSKSEKNNNNNMSACLKALESLCKS